MTLRDPVVYEFGPVQINPCNRTLNRGSESVQIPPRGFDALLLLLERRGQVVSKGELLSTIWQGAHVEESNLPVMISAIRRAIGDDGRSQKYIQTVSRSGYRFVGDVTEISSPGAQKQKSRLSAISEPLAVDAVSHVQAPPPGIRHSGLFIAAGCLAAISSALLFVPRLSTRWADTRKTSSSHMVAEMWSQKGRYAWDLQTKDGMLRSIEYYEKAIAADPDYGEAYAGLVKSYVTLPSYSERPRDEQIRKTRAAAARAVSLGSQLADSHVALGMVFLIVDQNFASAEKEFEKAIALDSQSSLAEGELAFSLVAVGLDEQAVAHARRAKALNPVSVRAATDLGIVLYYSHRFTEAESEFQEILKLDPYSYRARVNLGKTYLSLGRFDDARRELERASGLSNRDPLADGLAAAAMARAGDVESAESILQTLEQRARTTYVAPLSLAFALSGLGRRDETLEYLRKAREERTIGAIFLNVDPNWESLHDIQGFRDLVGGIRLRAAE